MSWTSPEDEKDGTGSALGQETILKPTELTIRPPTLVADTPPGARRRISWPHPKTKMARALRTRIATSHMRSGRRACAQNV